MNAKIIEIYIGTAYKNVYSNACMNEIGGQGHSYV